MTGLAEWLLEAITEDEIHAGIMVTGRREMRWQWSTHGYSGPPTVEIAGTGEARPPIVATVQGDRLHEHIARWDPARVLAECAAKRRIVEWHTTQREDECCEERWGPMVFDTEPEISVGTSVSGDLTVHRSIGYEERIGCITLMHLAAPYSDRPGFREEWRV